MKYKKKPVTIDAWRVSDIQKTLNREEPLPSLVKAAFSKGVIKRSGRFLIIETLEGMMNAQMDDMLICGIGGEFYPCKPDIFIASYEEVT